MPVDAGGEDGPEHAGEDHEGDAALHAGFVTEVVVAGLFGRHGRADGREEEGGGEEEEEEELADRAAEDGEAVEADFVEVVAGEAPHGQCSCSSMSLTQGLRVR